MLFPDLEEGAIYLRRNDPQEPLGSFSKHSFKLEDVIWPSVEHYYQAMKFDKSEPEYAELIRGSKHPKEAQKLGRKKRRSFRKDWKKVRRVMMTRAVYTKCRAHPDVSAALLETGDAPLVNNSQYDYFWGCGRDRRGENMFGQVLMDVRKKLREESE